MSSRDDRLKLKDHRLRQALLLAAVALSVPIFAACSDTSPTDWSSRSHLRYWEKLRLYGEQAQQLEHWQQSEKFLLGAVEEAQRATISDAMIGDTYALLADSQLHEGQTKTALKNFDKAIRFYNRYCAKKMNSKLSPLTQLEYANVLAGKARTQTVLGLNQESIVTYQSALSAYGDSDGDALALQRLRARALCQAELAKIYTATGQETKAKEAFQSARTMLHNQGCQKVVSDIAAMEKSPASNTMLTAEQAPTAAHKAVGTQSLSAEQKGKEWEKCWAAYQKAKNEGEDAQAEREVLRSYDLSQDAPAEIKHRTSVTTICFWYGTHGDWGKGLRYFEEDFELSKQHFGEQDEASVLPLNRLAMAYIHTGRILLAEQTIDKAIALATTSCGKDSRPYLRVLKTKAEISLKLKRLAECKTLALQSASTANKLEDFESLCSCNLLLGKCELNRGNYSAAKEFFAKAVQTADEHLNYGPQWESFAALAEASLMMHDMKAADDSFAGAESALIEAANGRTLHTLARRAAPAIFRQHIQMLKAMGQQEKARATMNTLTQVLRPASQQ